MVRFRQYTICRYNGLVEGRAWPIAADAVTAGEGVQTVPLTIEVEREDDGRWLAEVPELISNLFYRVRFGEEELSDEELEGMERTLTSLETALSGREKVTLTVS